METVQSLLDEVFLTVSVKALDNGIYRAWGVGKGIHNGKVVYSDGGTALSALEGLQRAVESGAWRKDRFQRAF